MAFKVFVDGHAGTTGLQIHQRLAEFDQIELLQLPDELRKDPDAKKKIVNQADLIFLCLPDDAARQTVALIENDETRVVDASTAHRTEDGWVYGLPELNPQQRDKIKHAKRVAVTGCHAAASILALAPLSQQKLLIEKPGISLHSLTGYSGGGKQMIADYQAPTQQMLAPRPYALGLAHKHIPEIMKYGMISQKPVFLPIVGNYEQGLAITLPLHREQFSRDIPLHELYELYQNYYKDEPFIRLLPLSPESGAPDGFYDVQACVGTNRVDISLYGDDEQCVIMVRLDNLGKGASGAAIQCMNLMLGLPENTGLLVD